MNVEEFIWPNFYIVGAVKSGTTSLWASLKRHPQVFLPKVKEPYFFNCPRTLNVSDSGVISSDLREYQNLYRPGRGFNAIDDATPNYLVSPPAAPQIHQICPQAKIIIILRDPVERAYAHYLMPASGV